MSSPVLHIVLHQPEIHYNAGAVGRTCVALGAKLWLVRPLGFRLDDRHMRRAGLDYWQHLQWEVIDQWADFVERFGEDHCWFFSKTASRSYTEARFEPGEALVFGSESAGLPRSLLEANAQCSLRIPTRPEVRSLNLSVSVGVAAFEARRQWTERGQA
jgi:tRNA (cytidine/uridine-2'-O-)-methyltransferase